MQRRLAEAQLGIKAHVKQAEAQVRQADELRKRSDAEATRLRVARKLAEDEERKLADMQKVQLLLQDGGGIPGLVATAKSGSAAAQEQAAWVLRNLANGSGQLRFEIVSAGALPSLVGLVKSGSAAAQEQAAWALKILADNSRKRTSEFRDADAYTQLADLMNSKSGSAAAREHASAALAILNAPREPEISDYVGGGGHFSSWQEARDWR
jgi:hypothetical protein